MKKYIPNVITSVRVALALVLMFFSRFDAAFYTIYIICAVTDIIDGPLARKLGSTSLLGAVLDTTGDFLFYLAMIKIVVMNEMVPLWLILFMAFAVLGHVVSAVIAKIRFHKFYFTHAIAAKVAGCLMFFIPFVFLFSDGVVYMTIVCVVTLISAVEAIVIQSKITSLDADTRSFRSALRSSGENEAGEEAEAGEE